MTHANAIRFLAHQARECRGRDEGEMLCLLFPSLCDILGLEPMEDAEAAAFRHDFKQRLAALPFKDDTDREAQAHPARAILREGQAQTGDQAHPAFA